MGEELTGRKDNVVGGRGPVFQSYPWALGSPDSPPGTVGAYKEGTGRVPDSHTSQGIIRVIKIICCGTSLVVQWLRIHPPMQGTQVRSLVWEDPTCHEASKPMYRNHWARALESMLHNKRNHRNEKPAHHNSRGAPVHCNYIKAHEQQRPSTAKINYLIKNK